MDRAEIKKWAKEKIKGHIWELLVPILVAGILTSISIPLGKTNESGVSSTLNLGLFFYFVQVGLIWFMTKFNNDQEHEFKDIFYFSKDYVRIFLVNLLQIIFIALWTLLFIIPGIIKAFAYALVPYILADDKYKDLSYREVLKKSEEMMKGHKMDYFIFGLSFIGWFLLMPFTLGLIMIWLAPYFATAQVKFLNDIKTSQENGTPTVETTPTAPATAQVENAKKTCPNCGTEVDAGTEFCTNCGQKV